MEPWMCCFLLWYYMHKIGSVISELCYRVKTFSGVSFQQHNISVLYQ